MRENRISNLTLWLILLALAMLLTACSNQPIEEAPAEEAVEESTEVVEEEEMAAEEEAEAMEEQATEEMAAEEEEVASAGGRYQVPGFPPFAEAPPMLEILEDRGDTLLVKHLYGETEIPKNPQRVYTDASIFPSAVTLDLPLVGTQFYPDMPNLPNWDSYVDGVEAVPIVSYDFNYEEVLSLDPDLIIAYGNFFWTDTDPQTTYENASQIAPTIVLNDDPVAFFEQAVLDLGTLFSKDMATEVDSLNTERQPASRSATSLATIR